MRLRAIVVCWALASAFTVAAAVAACHAIAAAVAEVDLTRW